MKELARLTPAQTLLIIKGKEAVRKDLLKYTFMDLLLKKVLKTTKVSQRASKFDPVQNIVYVNTGKNFLGYKPALHEVVFLSPFQKSRSLKIMFRHMVKVGFTNSKRTNAYQNKIRETYELNDCTTRNLIQIIFGGFTLTKKGVDLQRELKAELQHLDSYLPSLMERDKREALDVLRKIKGNVFLLKNIDFELLTEVEKEFKDFMKDSEASTTSDTGCGSYTGCSGCFTSWDTFETHSHQFDSSCGSSDSGCSGSGCSGCSSSGCSGCGGCGGD